MLVFCRKRGERVVIGSSVEVEVLEITGNRVRLGFTAPPDVRIDRSEVRELKTRGVPQTARSK